MRVRAPVPVGSLITELIYMLLVEPAPFVQTIPEHVGVLLVVVRVTLVLRCSAETIFAAVAESIVMSVGSISHIPPLPALMLASRLIV